jgi:hypothetical protein
MICIGWMCTVMPWPEPEQVQVPAETYVEPAKELPWYVFDGHTTVGKMVHSQLRGTIQDRKEWAYITDDLQFNMESAWIDRLQNGSYWWPKMMEMLWRRYGKLPQDADRDWQRWRPVIQGMIEERIKGKDAEDNLPEVRNRKA